MERRALVLDANILIRAFLGRRVRSILENHTECISFFVPDTAYVEAEEHLAELVVKRGGDATRGLWMKSFRRSFAETPLAEDSSCFD